VDPVTLPFLDDDAMRSVIDRHRALAKPPGSLGRLETLSGWLAAVQGSAPPRPLQRVRVVLFAGDHGVTAAGVSANPPDLTVRLVAAIGSGGTAAEVLARQVSATVRVVDAGVVVETPTAAGGRKVRAGTADIRIADAMTRDETEAAIALGRSVADEEIDAGADLLVPGNLGRGSTTVAATIVGALLREEPVTVVGRDTTLDDATWCRKVGAVRDALRRVRAAAVEDDSIGLLTVAGGPDIAALTGFLLQAAVRRTPVILDGLVVTTAALLADRLALGARGWQVAGHLADESAHGLALDALGLVPLLDLDARLGEATGGLLAVPLLTAAVAIATEMATLTDVGFPAASNDGLGAPSEDS
jgi:nicotinate-nucleotide--dimethylbenzimidazole phosphoribosyltransferase